jgi:hypothetical protein
VEEAPATPRRAAWYTTVGEDIKTGFSKLTKNIETSLVSAGDSIGLSLSLFSIVH